MIIIQAKIKGTPASLHESLKKATLSNKLQKLGFIRVASKEVSEDNRIRVYLSITETGLDYLSDCIASYKDFNHDINEILSTDVLK